MTADPVRLKNALPLFFVVVFLLWGITNISSTVMSFADGRSISLGLVTQSDEYIQANAPIEIIEDINKLKNGVIPRFGEWLISSFYGDSLNYMALAMGHESYEPYSLRPLYPALVRFVSEARLLGMESNVFQVYSSSFFILNVIFFLLSILAGANLISKFINDEMTALFISISAFFQLGYLKTLYAPMVDQPAVFLAILVVHFSLNNKIFILTIVSVAAILTKDSLIIMGAVPAVMLLANKNLKMLLPCVAFLVTFVALRIFSESDPLSLQYGWEVSKGDIRLDYFKSHFSSLKGVVNWLAGIWFSFGPSIVLCAVLLISKRPNKSIKILLVAMLCVALLFVFAQVMLASSVARTLTPSSVLMVMLTLSVSIKYYRKEIYSSLSLLRSGNPPEKGSAQN